MPHKSPQERKVAAVIPAKDEAKSIAATLRACRAIPGVDLLVVVDDGSTDDTQHVARAAGAVVVRHSVNRGKASAMETGAKVVFMRDPAEGPSRLLLFLDADLGDSAAGAAPLVAAVQSKAADCAVAVLPPQRGAGGRGFVVRAARAAIEYATGWEPLAPLSGQRCVSREVFETIMPLASGWGAEIGMSIDLLVNGYSIIEVPCDLTHRVSRDDAAGHYHRLAQYIDVQRAAVHRFLARRRLPAEVRLPAAKAQKPFVAYWPDEVVEGT